jgi:uncharacterized repeat protein (TIGR01451 family)
MSIDQLTRRAAAFRPAVSQPSTGRSLSGAKPRRSPAFLLFLATLCLSGCYGVTHNPSDLPHLVPFGDIVRTHAKPGGFAYFWNFDRHACSLDVKPRDATNPVGVQQVFIATVMDEDGKPRHNRRVEWLLEGAGNIIEVDESGFFPGRGYKVDNKYAVSYTDWLEHTITRGTGRPGDDFTILPGQSWCVVTSAVEGDTKVTVYAPEIQNWEKNRIVVSTRWVDALWQLPPPAVCRSGMAQVLSTEVFAPADRRPLANYLVRYKIIDGPPAVFMPARAPEATAITDINGMGSVSLVQLQAEPGVNRIAVEIVRGPDPTAPSGTGVIIGRGEAQVTWEAPKISLNSVVPPTTFFGQDATFTLNVTNNGRVASQEMTVKSAIPEGATFVKSDPPPAVVDTNNRQLIWTLAGLQANGQQHINVIFHPSRPGPITETASLVTRDGQKDEQTATTQVTVAHLDLRVTGPDTAMVGAPLEFQIELRNTGTAPIQSVLITDDFDAGLEHESHVNTIKKTVGPFAAGEATTVRLTLTPRQVGKLANRVSAVADGGLNAKGEHVVDVRQAAMKIDISGPERKYVNKPVTWQIKVSNPGELPLNNIVVRDLLPAELGFVSASAGGAARGPGEVVWTLSTLPPSQTRILELTTNALHTSAKVMNSVQAVADGGVQASGQAGVEINGLPAFRIDVKDRNDPIEVGQNTSYDITIINRGTMAGSDIEITASVPPQLKVLNVRGPTQPKVEGGKITFPPLATLPVGQQISYGVDVQAVQAGRAVFEVQLKTPLLKEPVTQQESTTIIGGQEGNPASGVTPASTDEPPR